MNTSNSDGSVYWVEMGALSKPAGLWGLPLWGAVPLLAILLPSPFRLVGLMLLPVTIVLAWYSQRAGLPGRWLPGLLLAGFGLPCSIAVANGDDDPCAEDNPNRPAWCEDYTPPVARYPEGTLQPNVPLGDEPRTDGGQAMFLAGTTVVAPPPVLWLNGRPHQPSKVYGSGQSLSFVQALEMILPSGWTIWTSESPDRLNAAIGSPVLWDGNGRPWPDVLEDLAQQYGVEVTADTDIRRLAIGRLPSTAVMAADSDPLDPVAVSAPGGGEPSVVVAPPSATEPSVVADVGADVVAAVAAVALPPPDAEIRPPTAPPGQLELRRQYDVPGRLSVEPLPDTIGRVAWRLVPLGVQLDLSALGAYVNAPIYKWDLSTSVVSPKSALETLMPLGYCLDETHFPLVKTVVCGRDELVDTSDAGADEGMSQ